MAVNRIVSFLPSATELLFELGVGNKIYGVTHECIYPDSATKKPKVISSVFDPKKLNSQEIDKKTTELSRDGNDIFKLDEKILLDANPDMIISQTTCDVCAAHNNQVEKAMKILPKKPIVHSMDPHNLQEIMETVSDLGKIINLEREATQLKEKLLTRINQIKNIEKKSQPKVLAIEWIKPFFTAGHWIPEMIQTAGGQNLISKEGEHSRRISINEIANSDPDIIIIMPCGFDLKRTQDEYYKFLSKDKEWNKIRAVKDGSIFAVDANSFFSKPSIRTVIGLEILAKIIHPNEFKFVETPADSFSQIN